MAGVSELVAAITGRNVEQGARIAAAAQALGVDAMDFCAHRFGLGGTATWERAAKWAGLAFAQNVRASLLTMDCPTQPDALAGVRTARARVFDRDIVLAAPNAEQFVALKASVETRPDLGETVCIVPPAALRFALAGKHSPTLMDEARQRLARRWPGASADLDLTLAARVVFIVLALFVLALVSVSPFFLRPLLLPLTALLFMVPGILRLAAALPGTAAPALDSTSLLPDAELPIYTVLIPLRNEVHMVPNLARAMRALDYPPEKLDVKFVVEARSPATIEAVTAELDDPRFELVPVPDERPRTKPKALNYALPFVRGQHVVVFDAEDVPEPRQLRLAATLFAHNPEIDCLQAELTIDNADENWLTAMFSAEYAGQFGLMMPALSHWRLPMPLGGTSNHFNTRALRALGGWDAFNVTEDADLGIRLARLRHRSATFASHTGEEAPITLTAWMAQRTRWMKGWMQTFIVHSRRPMDFIKDAGCRSFLAFEIYVGSLIISALLHNLFLATIAIRLALGQPILSDRFDIWSVISVLALVLGYGGVVVLMAAGLIRQRRFHHLVLLPSLPIYWLLHSLATLRAAHELLVRPSFWAKTEHGRSRVRKTAPSLMHTRNHQFERSANGIFPHSLR